MKLSYYLQQKIAKLRDVLLMTESDGWAYFEEQFVAGLERHAFEAWKATPAEKQLDIIEAQQQGKLADAIRAWPKKVELQIQEYSVTLEAIKNDEQEDFDVSEGGRPIRAFDA